MQSRSDEKHAGQHFFPPPRHFPDRARLIFDRLARFSFAISLLHVSESLAEATNLLYDIERPLKRRRDSLLTGSNRNKK